MYYGLGEAQEGDEMSMTEVQRDVDNRSGGLPARLVERIAERVGGVATTSAVYGTPVERDGITVIPVARLRWGFGAGGGTGSARGEEFGNGGGGGGGVMAAPMGFIAIADGRAEFQAIRQPMRGLTSAAIILASGAAAWLALTALRRLVRG
jgi:uncharacterized spore protein YtfJ